MPHVLPQVFFLISHSTSPSQCSLAGPQPSPLQVLLCQLLTYQGLLYSPRLRPLEGCPLCPAPGCHRQASCQLPLYRQAPCHPAPNREPQFPCTQGVSTARVMHPPWHLVPMFLWGQGIHREAPVLLLWNRFRPLLSLLPPQVNAPFVFKKSSIRFFCFFTHFFLSVLR